MSLNSAVQSGQCWTGSDRYPVVHLFNVMWWLISEQCTVYMLAIEWKKNNESEKCDPAWTGLFFVLGAMRVERTLFSTSYFQDDAPSSTSSSSGMLPSVDWGRADTVQVLPLVCRPRATVLVWTFGVFIFFHWNTFLPAWLSFEMKFFLSLQKHFKPKNKKENCFKSTAVFRKFYKVSHVFQR